MSKEEPLNIGDLVEITMTGSAWYRKRGIVVARIHYDVHGGNHPDEYNCEVAIIGDKTRAIRAKWLKLLSRKA